MSLPLTPRQQQVYEFIRSRIADGVPPTVREIGAAVGIRGPNGVVCHLKSLERKGWITRGDHRQSRSIRLVNGPKDDVQRLRQVMESAAAALETRGGHNVADAGRAYRLLMDALEQEPPSKEAQMLILSRKKCEEIVIGDDIRVVLVDIRGNTAKIGIDCPKDIGVYRKEVWEAIKREQADGSAETDRQ